MNATKTETVRHLEFNPFGVDSNGQLVDSNGIPVQIPSGVRIVGDYVVVGLTVHAFATVDDEHILDRWPALFSYEDGKKITGPDAILIFDRAGREGEMRSCWSYSPNGGDGGPMGTSCLVAGDGIEYPSLTVNDPYSGEEYESFQATYNPETRELTFSTPPPDNGGACVGVVHKYVYSWEENDLATAEVVACYGAHYGWMWGSSYDEIGVFDLPVQLETNALKALLQYRNTTDSAAEIGVERLGDPTDDGINFAVIDGEKFTHVAKQLAIAFDGLEDVEEEAEAVAVNILAFYPEEKSQPQWLELAEIEVEV